jgi:AraC-like DNA-binding protein
MGITLELGFVHISQFFNWFRKSVGHAPREFRQNRPSSKGNVTKYFLTESPSTEKDFGIFGLRAGKELISR